MDELDAAILALLQTDGRMTNRELSKRLGIAPSTCLKRLGTLRWSGLIKGFHADVDFARLGRPVEAMISARLRPQSRKVIESFRDFVLSLPQTIAVYVVTGDEDVLIHVAVPSTLDLRDFVLDHLTQRDEVAGLRTSVVFEHQRKSVIGPAGG